LTRTVEEPNLQLSESGQKELERMSGALTTRRKVLNWLVRIEAEIARAEIYLEQLKAHRDSEIELAEELLREGTQPKAYLSERKRQEERRRLATTNGHAQ